MALPDRPVVAVVGDGSSLYTIQALWSAARYGVGRDLRRAGQRRVRDHGPTGRGAGATGAWPGFGAIDIAAMARAQGCPARRVETLEDLETALDEALDGIGERTEPLLLEVVVAPDSEFLI